MPLVFLTEAEEVTVKLLDVVLRDGDVGVGLGHGVHDFGVASDFLLVTGRERLNLDVREKAFDFTIRELAAFDPGGGADALDGGDPAKGLEAFRGQRSEGSPRPLELIQFGYERQNLGRDGEGFGGDHREGFPRIDPQ